MEKERNVKNFNIHRATYAKESFILAAQQIMQKKKPTKVYSANGFLSKLFLFLRTLFNTLYYLRCLPPAWLSLSFCLNSNTGEELS